MRFEKVKGKRGWFKESKRHALSRKGIKTKNKSYKDLKRLKLKLKPMGDADRDGYKNAKDCRPLDPMRHYEVTWSGNIFKPKEVEDMAELKKKKQRRMEEASQTKLLKRQFRLTEFNKRRSIT